MIEKEKEITVDEIIKNLTGNDFKIYLFTMDTKGNPLGSVAHIYDTAKNLISLGYNAVILHEKPIGLLDDKGANIGYTPVSSWLGEEYDEIPHEAIEKQELQIRPSDFIIIPEVFANVLDSIKKFPSKQIILLQSYDYVFELMGMGMGWTTHYGIRDVIATSDKLANYAKSLYPTINTHVVPVSIPDYFKPSDKPTKPIINLMSREQGDASKIVKSFYTQFPLFKWISFRELRGVPRKAVAEALQEGCLSVWIDDKSSFGTFPIESIECNSPVIGRVPNMVPEWMVGEIDENKNAVLHNNGLWVNSTLDIPGLIAEYVQVWLEDAVPENLVGGLDNLKGMYTNEKQLVALKEVYGGIVDTRIKEYEAIKEAEVNKEEIKKEK